MVQINFALKEVNCKIVYYGPGMSGKTTNLEVVHQKAPGHAKGELTSIATEGDRTLFFDFLPLDLGQVAGMRTKFQLYTVPGQVYYNATRKLVLQGADGIIFVADSQVGKEAENLESLKNLQDNLAAYRMSLDSMPFIIQYNKRDLPNVMSVDECQAKLNPFNAPYFEASAITGEGVFPTLKKLASMVLESLNKGPKRSSGAGAGQPAPQRPPQPGQPGAQPPRP
ncbi:MAG: GTPase, partial [Planctomycetota bacterium]